MKKSEMLKIIKDTLDRVSGVDPETGKTLRPPHEYTALSILLGVEEAGMLPPYVPSKQDIIDEDDFGRINVTNYKWEDET